ncbi:beta-galactosidase trimerization domain-containing protein [Streptomyces sp. NPDC006529]|uniref:beta-galactosidase trimerization domain-containing protein n=1 Tax=Streptomyces sp. NPDC006529 TaxID=3157177 RepID=UPI0033B19CD4
MWALEADGLPSARLDYHAPLAAAHRALWDAGVTADFARPEHELGGYRLVVAPSLFLLSDRGAENLRHYVEGGGTLLVQHASGYVDERVHARLGGYPAAPPSPGTAAAPARAGTSPPGWTTVTTPP